jgi:SAM-dependent methyltransferase
MQQNIYDRPDFFAGYSQLTRSVHGLDGAPEWPSVRALLPDLSGMRVVDLGCGFGWFCRFARRQGAERVVGIDLSQNMIARAKAETDDPAVDYAIGDLDRIELSEASFDFAYSSLAFHYVEDFRRLMGVVYRALAPGSSFVFTIEHPIFMAPSRPGWLPQGDGGKIWPLDRYGVEGPRTTDWISKGVVKQHRTMTTTLNTLVDEGFTIRRIEEWMPSREQVVADPPLADEFDRPTFLIVAAQR